MADNYLELRNLHVSYGNVEALHGINIEVKKGEIVSILGANGAGKTTTLASISGLLKPDKGEILFKGKSIHTLLSHEIVHLGITHSPEGRRVFGTLTVEENLELGAFTSKNKERNAFVLQWIYELFPRLRERSHQLSGTLSGGEQQMLAIARALMGDPKILLLDEPSLGLAPILVRAIFDSVREINKNGVTVVLVEQNARAALSLAQRAYVLEVGRVAMQGSAKDLLSDPNVQKAYLGGNK